MLSRPSAPTAPPVEALGSREDDGIEPPFGAAVAAAAGVRLGPPKSEKDMMIVEYGSTCDDHNNNNNRARCGRDRAFQCCLCNKFCV
jgi:hypothetical protein